MLEQFGWLSLLPPLLTVALAFWLRSVIPALLAGVVSACLVLSAEHPLQTPIKALDRLVQAAAVPDNLRLLLFSVLVGGLIALLRKAQTFQAFAQGIERAAGGVRRRLAYGLTLVLGTTLFLETWSNVLVNGTALRSFYDRLGISRERMAYFMHTVAISTVSLVPINSWAAFYLGLLRAQEVEQPFQFLLASLPFVLYCWVSLALIVVVMSTGWTIGPLLRFDGAIRRDMSVLQAAAGVAAPKEPVVDRVRLRGALLIAVLGVLIAAVLLGLVATGGGDPRNGDGAASVLYAVVASIAFAALAFKVSGLLGLRAAEDTLLSGCGEFVGIGVLILLALTLGSLIKELGTGVYVASLFEASVPRELFAPLLFVVGALMSFATGTSYGTFAIMIPIALPLAAATGANPHLLFGACIAGGVFGDNTSPVSDTSIITAAATEVQLIDHVATQLPYALVSAAAATLGFLVLGLILN